MLLPQIINMLMLSVTVPVDGSAAKDKLPVDMWAEIAPYLEDKEKRALQHTNKAYTQFNPLSKGISQGMNMDAMYEKFKQLIDDTDLTKEQLFNSFT